MSTPPRDAPLDVSAPLDISPNLSGSLPSYSFGSGTLAHGRSYPKVRTGADRTGSPLTPLLTDRPVRSALPLGRR